MSDPLITLTTDFGEGSPYVAAVKGVILSFNPNMRLLDLSHHIRPQDLRGAGFFLAGTIPFFPQGTTHLIVVDPGVGSSRALLHVQLRGQTLLVPDNGCWTYLAEREGATPLVRKLAEPRYWRHNPSSTFHGRDILAPVAAHLTLGVRPESLGPVVDRWEQIAFPVPIQRQNSWQGEVIYVDPFGNVITNLKSEVLAHNSGRLNCRIGDVEIGRLVRTYSDVPRGELAVLSSSFGLVEIAINCGNAAQELRAAVGMPVVLAFDGAPASPNEA